MAGGVPAVVGTAAPAAAATTTYTVTNLGSLGGGYADATAINASGQVTGYSALAKEIQVPCPPGPYGQPKKCFEPIEHAFLYSNGTMTDLGTLGGTGSQGAAINNSGDVVGSPYQINYATGINDNGQIVANAFDTATDQLTAILLTPH